MNKPQFVYVSYIASSVEKVWNALTDAELTKQYWWRHRNASDWKIGSRWTHEDYDDASRIDIVGNVIESAPPRRLVISWARPADEANPGAHSRVTFEIEPYDDLVRLTVAHFELEAGSEMLEGISRGWPAVLSSLKTLLETGQALSISLKRQTGSGGVRATA